MSTVHLEENLKSMKINEQLRYSIKTRESVKNLNIRFKTMFLAIRNDPTLNFSDIPTFIRFSFRNTKITGGEMFNSEMSLIERMPKEIICQIDGFTMRDWIHHFCEVINKPRLDFVIIDIREDLVNLRDLKRSVGEVPEIHASRSHSVPFYEQLLKLWPSVQTMNVVLPTVLNQSLGKVYMQNVDSFYMSKPSFEQLRRIFSDDFLHCNAKYIVLNAIPLTDKNMNRIVKLWSRGALPNLALLQIKLRGNGPTNRTIVLKGLKVHHADEKRILNFDYSAILNTPLNISVRGGVDIMGRNGKRATVKFGSGANICFNVWK